MEFVRIFFHVLRVDKEWVLGKKFEQLGCIQYQHGDGGSQLTRQPTDQMSMADVQGYLSVASGARMIAGWRICSNLRGSSTRAAVDFSSVRLIIERDVPTFAVIHQANRDIFKRSAEVEIWEGL